MGSLLYAGVSGDDPEGILVRSSANAQLASGPSRGYTDGKIIELADSYATKVYVDDADAQFATPNFYQSRDALNVPLSSRGQPDGVASLDAAGKIPVAQTPVLGFGTMRGPWGIASTSTGTTGSTPLKIGEFQLGQTAWNFYPMAFLTVLLEVTNGGRAAVEVRSGTPANTTYASQKLVARGVGGAMREGVQSVAVFANGAQDTLAPNDDARLTVWVFNVGDDIGQVTASVGAIWTAAAYARRAQP